MTSMQAVQNFLLCRRIAMVGLSRDPTDFSWALFKELRNHGYDMVAVNPQAREIEGRLCFARLQDIQPPVDGVLLMTKPQVTDQVVRDCAEAGVKHVWMYRAGGAGAVSVDAVEYCLSKGISVVPGECPFMFLQHSGWFHHLHGWINKIIGSYPRAY